MFSGTQFFPTAVAGEGANNKKINTSAPSSDTTTTCSFGTTTTVRFILAKPLTSNSTSATPSGGQDFGWNILKADMNNPSAETTKRLIPAGDWVFRGSLSASTQDTLSSNYGLKIYVHKRSSSGALTELFNVTSTMAAITSTLAVTVTKTGVAEILLATDETIHVEYWVQGRGGGATGVLSQTITFTLSSSVDIVIPSPGIMTAFYKSLLSTLVGVVARSLYTRPIAKLSTLVGVASYAKALTLYRSFSTSMAGVTSSQKYTKPNAKLVTMTGVVTRLNYTRLSAKLVTMTGLVSSNNYTRTSPKLVTMVGVASFSRALNLYRSFAVTMTGVPGFNRVITAVRSFSVSMIGLTSTWILIPQNVLNRISGSGGTTVIRKIFGVFD